MVNLCFKKVRKARIAALFLLAILLLITNPAPLRKALHSILIPLETLGANLRGSSSSFYSALKENERLVRENERLKAEIGRLSDKIANFSEVFKENARLREILGYKEKSARKIIVANVLGYDPALLFSTIVIDRGAEDGIRKGLCVVVIKEEREILLGRVKEVSPSSSIVLLVTDKSSLIPAILAESGEKGVLVGAESHLSLSFIESYIDPKLGEEVLTVEEKDIPGGILIGRVYHLGPKKIGLFREIKVKAGFEIGKLREVLVIVR